MTSTNLLSLEGGREGRKEGREGKKGGKKDGREGGREGRRKEGRKDRKKIPLMSLFTYHFSTSVFFPLLIYIFYNLPEVPPPKRNLLHHSKLSSFLFLPKLLIQHHMF